LQEARTGPPQLSLDLLAALHARWTTFLRALPEADFQRTFTHPEWGTTAIDVALSVYSWHGRHHTAHIRTALDHPERAR
jgi:hypothetical protein